MSPILKLVLEIGPLAAFFITFNRMSGLNELDALIWATGAFMIALLISITVTYALTRTISKVAVFTTVIVLATGGLTIWLQDGIFIKMKPTLVNGLFAITLAYGLFRGQSYLKYLIGDLLPLSETGWMKITRNWALFFAIMAVLNEAIWRTQSTEFWVNAKTFGYLPITLLFTFSQAPLMAKHALPDAEAAENKDPAEA
ncbi:MAG: septation protein A [Rhodobacteraceae bacterium]|nr:septation protein A [Paracoccaceae bacterium]